MAEVEKRERQNERKIAREKRAKEQAKTKLRDEIRRVLIDKVQVVSPATSQELVDIHGCYERGKTFLCSLGGQLQQLYYVLNAIFKALPEDKILQEYYTKMNDDPKQESLKNPKNPRELLLEVYFVPWLVTAIKELKCDFMQFLIPPEMEQLIASFKLPKNAQENLDFTKVTDQQYIAFRHAFVEERMYNSVYKNNSGQNAMEMLLSVLCMIICNRVPKGVVVFRSESIAHKVKLINVPRGVEV